MGGIQTGLTDAQLLASQLKAHELTGMKSSASEIDNMVLISGTRNWIDYITIKTVQELANGVIKYTDSQGSYYRKIIDSPYEDIIYADENLTIQLTRRT